MVHWIIGSILHGGPIELFLVLAGLTTSYNNKQNVLSASLKKKNLLFNALDN